MSSQNEEDANVVTREDREFLDPVLGGSYMVDLMMRDREAWQQTGTLITQAFVAGKKAAASSLEWKILRLEQEVGEARMGDDW